LFLAVELGKTLTELRQSMTEEEFLYWVAYYQIKHEKEENIRQRAKNR
tara:strand:+ start:1144 stop:1287 length:144 start_codon:yes stop_codon:yes gene_type:complete